MTWEPPIRLDEAWDKLGRARQHFEPLRVEIEAFEDSDAHTFSVDIDADAGEYVYRVHSLEVVP